MEWKNRYCIIALSLLLLTACGTQDDVITPSDDDQIIHVGGVSTADMMVTSMATRADATFPDWLKEGLKDPMHILYFKGDKKQLAILKYDENSGFSFTTDEDTPQPCKWLDNGAHTFEGVYAPKNLLIENETQDYNDLCYYTAIPPSKKIAATIDKITIPLQHRLARVVAYVLIDKSMNTTLKGYDKDNTENNKDVKNTLLRFCNVDVLDYVDGEGHPVWKMEKKAIPNFIGVETVKVYKEKVTGKLIFPIDDEWQTANADTNNKYTYTEYESAPYYDLIVRPTYTKDEYAMYDEKTISAKGKNKIDFELTLANDLEYEKEVEFDLNANDETVVYLRISPEKIDYNSTGSRLWQSKSYADDYYGVDNDNHSLSYAGSSWQRAYTNGTTNPAVTDGNAYSNQYVKDDKWIELLKAAKDGGSSVGKYFILQNDITIDVSDITEEFVFKGHLDGLDHTITLTGTENRNYLFDDIGTGWNSELLNVKVVGGTLFKPGVTPTGHVNNCWNGDSRIDDVTPDIPTY